jgi:hypothetical protein
MVHKRMDIARAYYTPKPRVIFYHLDETRLQDRNFSSAIARCFGIDKKVLLGKTSVDKVNIAQRMRWAST